MYALVCIWRCEHARFYVEVFYALYIHFHSFTFIHFDHATSGGYECDVLSEENSEPVRLILVYVHRDREDY